MSAKTLLIVGLVWFGAVALTSLFGFSFAVDLGRGKGASVLAGVLAIVIGCSSLIFTFGWIVPLAVGAYRLVRK